MSPYPLSPIKANEAILRDLENNGYKSLLTQPKNTEQNSVIDMNENGKKEENDKKVKNGNNKNDPYEDLSFIESKYNKESR
jgi:hypothetical protein